MSIVFWALILFLYPPEGSKEANEWGSRMEARYRSAKTLQATFLQRYLENGAVLRSEAGTAYFRRPGKMRWEYERPEKDLFLVDGKTAWFYVPADHTVTRAAAKQSEDLRTPLALLAGRMKISRICARVNLADSVTPLRQGDVVLHCVLRGARRSATSPANPDAALEADNIDAIFFEIVPQTGELARLIVRQPAGIEVEFRFENWRFDPPLPETMFRFDPPTGVAIVNGDAPQAKIPGN
jgi:outer membrane lipoprotein carrier protein